MKNTDIARKATYMLACSLGLVFVLAGCSSDDAAQVIADEFVTVSGRTNDVNGTALAAVNIEGVYSDPGSPLNPDDDSGATGSFSLQLLKNTAFYLRATKDTFASMNSARLSLSANEPGLVLDMPTEEQAQIVIDTAFGAGTLLLVNHAWLVVDVVDAFDGEEELNNKAVISSVAATGQVYTDCSGNDSRLLVTTGAPCGVDGRDGPMYIAYFDTTAEIDVTVDSVKQRAPIRMGEITYLEFEVGTFERGKLKYDADCAQCHGAGVLDPVNSASDLADQGELLIPDLKSIQGMRNVRDLTELEMLDLFAFLEDPSIQ